MRSTARLLLIFGFAYSLNVAAPAQTNISGFVKDSLSGEMLIGAHILEKGTTHGVITDDKGYYNIIIELPADLEVSFVGYITKEIKLGNVGDTVISVPLSQGTTLESVVIKARENHSLNTLTISRNEMYLSPSLGATPDILKTIQLKPGVQTQNEGSSVLLVRGGNPGENQYLLDGVPLIHVNHIGGYLSVFNPEIINNLTIYKGGFPSRFGGKLSSVVDISQREGNITHMKGSLSLGITDASFSLEGPILDKRFTYIVTARKTLTEALFLSYYKLIDEEGYSAFYGFHDMNCKLSWRPGEKNSIHFNIYQGDDYMRSRTFEDEVDYYAETGMKYVWGNFLLSARWNSMISRNLFLTNKIFYTRYRLYSLAESYLTDFTNELETGLKYLSSIRDASISSDWKYMPYKQLQVEFGLKSSLVFNEPFKKINVITDSSLSPGYVKAVETLGYLEAIYKPVNLIDIRSGIRLVDYFSEGYNRFYLEPRINIKIGITERFSFTSSYMEINQNAHLMFTPQTLLNNEIWIPADENIPPAHAKQGSLGWQAILDRGRFEIGMEGYLKVMCNLATYKEGYTNLLYDMNWRNKIEINGKGRAYGIELQAQKNYGTLTGNLNYTFSRATRQFPEINDGIKYLYEYDRTHSATINLIYQLNERLSFSASWIYQTGLPYTPAIGRYYAQSLYEMDGEDPFYFEGLVYGDRNSDRMKDYHRLDVALVYKSKMKKRKYQSTWTFSVYNIYNRHNPFYYYYHYNNSSEIIGYSPDFPGEPSSLYQFSVFPIIPSISYKVYFEAQENRDKKTLKQKILKWLYYEE